MKSKSVDKNPVRSDAFAEKSEAIQEAQAIELLAFPFGISRRESIEFV
jgi:hypothetical protein